MVVFIFFWVIVLILAIIFLPFLGALMQDHKDLKVPLEEKFNVTISIINQGLLSGTGNVIKTDTKKQVNLFSDVEANKLIQFFYGTGHLTIILKFKWYHKEMVFEKTFYNLRNASTYEQKDIANAFLEEASVRMEAHMSSAMGNINGIGTGPSVPLQDDPIDLVNNTFDELSDTQKKAIACFMFIIASADGTRENEVLEIATFRQELRYLRKNWKECKELLTNYGEQYIFQQLQGLDNGMATMLMTSCFPLVVGNQVMGPNEIRLNKFYYCFNEIGYNQEKVDYNIEKAIKLMELFKGINENTRHS